MPSTPRIAQPGDFFLLLVPFGEDLERLRQEQWKWQSRYGGQIVEPIHITVERFSPKDKEFPFACVSRLRQKLESIKPFTISADAIIQFMAPYWQSYVLRWRVERSAAWQQFRDRIKYTLEEIDCPSHFDRRRHATCTILKLEGKVDLPSPTPETDMPLFLVQELRLSTLKYDREFEILEKIKL
jgi:hypothetical protein